VGESPHASAALVKDLLIAVAFVALSLGLVSAIVFGLEDEVTFVSPPDIVAEEFVRALGDGRAGPARRMLASNAERVTPVESLLRVSRGMRRRYGTVDDVRARVADRNGEEVLVLVVVKGSRAEEEVRLPTVREWGEWKVTIPFGLLPSAEAPSPR
jgi:hypothetical protein